MPTATFRKGIVKSNKSNFISVPADETVQIVPMVSAEDMISADMHEFWEVNPFVAFPCFGSADCPGCKAENKTKFKGFLPIVTREGEVKIFSFGIKVARQLVDIESELGSIVGQVIKVKRSGSGLATNYTCIPAGKKIDISKYDAPSVEDAFGDLELSTIYNTMIARGLLEGELMEKPAKDGKKPKGKKSKDEDEETEWDV